MYYVYVHINPKTEDPFYIGMGKGKRAYDKDRSDEWLKTVKDLNYNYSIKIIKKNLTKEGAFNLENELIQKYRLKKEGGILKVFFSSFFLVGKLNLYFQTHPMTTFLSNHPYQ